MRDVIQHICSPAQVPCPRACLECLVRCNRERMQCGDFVGACLRGCLGSATVSEYEVIERPIACAPAEISGAGQGESATRKIDRSSSRYGSALNGQTVTARERPRCDGEVSRYRRDPLQCIRKGIINSEVVERGSFDRSHA